MADRIPRINEAMREVLSTAVADLSDPRIGFVTITGVSVARDLRNAKVYVSVLGDPKVEESTFAALRSSHGLLQRAVARHVKLRNTPQLSFERDATLETALRIEELVREEEQRNPGPTMTETTTTDAGAKSTLSEIAEALAAADKIVVATHENPDGDAIGSARAMEVALLALGKDVIVYVPKGTVPAEYDFIRPARLTAELPEDIAERTVFAVDCGNASRLAMPELLAQAADVLNVDHHADNTHYGRLNVVVGESPCASLLVWEIAGHLGIDRSPELATAAYVGLVTDTGRFQYSNTTPAAFALAAELVDHGVDVHSVFQQVFERLEWNRLKLLARGLEKSMRHDDGAIVTTHLTRADFEEAGADDDSAEGIVDFLRGVDGTLVAVFVRDLAPGGKALRKGSLRTTHDTVDVSTIARSYGGGGHRQAAGFSTDETMEQIIERVREGLRDQGQ
jgi:phosphoesterase RecJ-like protein